MPRAEALEPKLEIGADEGRIDALGDQRLVALGSETGTKIVSAVARSQRRARLHAVVADVDARAAGRAPGGEQREPVGVDRGIPAARPGRRVERLLQVDGEQDGAVEIDSHEAQLTQSRRHGS